VVAVTQLALDIVMPFYGDVAFMKEAVQSVLTQDDPDWRLLVVDDAHPDTSIAEWFSQLGDDRIEYHRNEVNLGITANFQRALDLATADLVTFLGCDDRMLPRYVTLARGAFGSVLADGVAVYQPGIRVIDEFGAPVTPLSDRIKSWLRPHVAAGSLHRLDGERLATRLLHGNWTYFPSLCWQRKIIAPLGFDPGYSVAQDLRLLMDVVLDGHAILLDDEVTFEYRRHGGSVSSLGAHEGGRFVEETSFFKVTSQRMRDHGWRRAARASDWHFTSRLNRLANRAPHRWSRSARSGGSPHA
jgi:glycosyltransferase involved in cell wall biosynthesis